MKPGKGRALAAAYLGLQAVIIAGWWIMLAVVPATRAWFVVGDWPQTTLLAFALPDVLVLVVGSSAAAIGFRRGALWALPLLMLITGAVLYATLWCIGSNLATGSGWLGTLMMLPAACGCALCVAWTRV